jgi:hypothetical protein
MSYEIIGIPGSRIEHHSVLSVAASNIAALSEFSSNVSEAVGKRPSARAPDNPSSTR